MRRYALAALVMAAGLTSCSQQEEARPLAPAASVLPAPPAIPEAQHYTSHLIAESYEHLTAAEAAISSLEQAIQTLIAQPEEDAVRQARRLWRESYSQYLIAQASMRLPVSEPPEWRSAGLTRDDLERQINSWPIEPGYIDYLAGYPYSGIVNDTALELTESSLLDQHQFADDSYVSIGFHAIEFLLWGESGQRTAADFDRSLKTVASEERPAVINQERRGDYLLHTVRLLRQHMQRLQLRWSPDTGYYASRLAEVSPEKTLQASMLTAQSLIADELLNRYMNEESSPFSKQSQADISALTTGLSHLLLPEDSATGLNPMLVPYPELSQRLQAGFAGTEECLNDWQQNDSEALARQNCRLKLIELLSALDQTAQQLGMEVPLSE